MNKVLYTELLALGFRGSIRPLVQWAMLRRERAAGGQRPCGRKQARQVEIFAAPEIAPTGTADQTKPPGSQSLAWLLLADEQTLPTEKKELLQQLKQDEEVSKAHRLAQQFLKIVRERQVAGLGPWLRECQNSGLRELASFAAGLQHEEKKVRAAVELPYSNGIAEGNVTRLKQIRRAMYGWGNFDLLKIRALVPT